MTNVVSLAAARDAREQRESNRLIALHHEHRPMKELRAEDGDADEWLWSAHSHMQLAFCETDGGTAVVSKAAISILLGKLEELLVNGVPWVPGEKWA